MSDELQEIQRQRVAQLSKAAGLAAIEGAEPDEMGLVVAALADATAQAAAGLRVPVEEVIAAIHGRYLQARKVLAEARGVPEDVVSAN